MVKYRYAKAMKIKEQGSTKMGFNMKVTPEIEALTKICEDHSKMDVSSMGSMM